MIHRNLGTVLDDPLLSKIFCDRMSGLDWYDYGARYYDGTRFTTMDPMAEKYYSISPYAYCANNPINAIDLNGDSIIIDKYGENLHRVGNSDNVYVQYGESMYEIGVLGKTINANIIINNMLNRNKNDAKNLNNIFSFINLVKTNGDWDLKNLKESIWKMGNEKPTTFFYNGEKLSSADIGNLNFGVVAKAFGIKEPFALRSAGLYQILSGTSKIEWIFKFDLVKRPLTLPSGVSYMGVDFDFAEPFGDDPIDQKWIKEGYKY